MHELVQVAVSCISHCLASSARHCYCTDYSQQHQLMHCKTQKNEKFEFWKKKERDSARLSNDGILFLHEISDSIIMDLMKRDVIYIQLAEEKAPTNQKKTSNFTCSSFWYPILVQEYTITHTYTQTNKHFLLLLLLLGAFLIHSFLSQWR